MRTTTRHILRRIPLLLLAVALVVWPLSHRVGVTAGSAFDGTQTVVALSSGELVVWRVAAPTWLNRWLHTFDSRTDPLDADFIEREEMPLTRVAGFAWGPGVWIVPMWAPAAVLAGMVAWGVRRRRGVRPNGFEVTTLTGRSAA